MPGFLSAIDRLLRGEGEFAATREAGLPGRATFATQLGVIVVCGATYGFVMGSFGGLGAGGWQQSLVSAIKVPFLYLVTFLLCLPPFFVFNVLAGVGRDFARVLNALLAFQAIAALVLAALGPITFLMNVSTAFYTLMILWNAVLFGVATFAGQATMRRLYRPLMAGNPRHRRMYVLWFGLYVFVGIQMAWVLRPFIGAPELPVQFFRRGAWGNAYMELLRIARDVVGL